jgi:hypothetical protein
MKRFYSIKENFDFLYNDVKTLLSEDIVDSSLSENWLANWYVCNKYCTTKAVEKYAAELIIPRLQDAEIPPDVFRSVIDRKLNGCVESYGIEHDLEDKLYLIENIKKSVINKNTFSYILEDFETTEALLYIEENYFKKDFKILELKVLSEDYKEILNIVSHIKHAILENYQDVSRMEYIKNSNNSILYKFKDCINENYQQELSGIYNTLEYLLIPQSDTIIEHVTSELNHMNELIEYLVEGKLNNGEIFDYEAAVEQFKYLVEEIFFEESEYDINLERFYELCVLTDGLCEYESTLEVSSRIITKGTEKVTRTVGNISSKSRGMSKSDSAVAQVKRGAKIVDDRVSGAINSQIDQIANFRNEAKREKVISGRSMFKLSRMLKTTIGAILAGKVVASLPKQKIIGIPFTKLWLRAPLLGLAVTIIGLIGSRAHSKHVEERERKRVLYELETELKIVKEKIEDAKGDNAKEQKYQLMRIESELEKEVFRIKHGMKPY